MIKYIYFLLGLTLFLSSCKIQYASKPYSEAVSPSAPDYANEKYWAVLPNKIPNQLLQFVNLESKEGRVDVFYVYPTLFKDPKNSAWNADVNADNFNKEILVTISNSAICIIMLYIYINYSILFKKKIE